MGGVWPAGGLRLGPVEGVGEAVSWKWHQVLAGGDDILDQCRGHTRLPSQVGGARPVAERCAMWKGC